MKIKELIIRLAAIETQYGDLEVYYFPYDWAKPAPMETLSVSKKQITGKTVLMIGAD